MYICTTGYLCNAISQIVLEVSCGFGLFPYFQITNASVALDFKLFGQNIPYKMISRKGFNIEKPGSAHLVLKKFQQKVSVRFIFFPEQFIYSKF